MPLHRLSEHRDVGVARHRRDARGRGREHVKRHRHRRAAASQGRSALPHRPRQLCRRHQAAGHGGGRVRAFAARPCARSSRSTSTSALAMPGVLAVLHGRGPQGGRRRRASLRLGHHRQGRSADEGAAAPGAGARQGAPRRRSGRVRRGGDARAGAAPPPMRSSSITRCCRRWSACSMPSSATRRFCSTTCRTICAATGRSATRLRPMRRSARRRTCRASAWSTIAWSAIRWSRARRSPNTMRRPVITRFGRRASFRTSCAC